MHRFGPVASPHFAMVLRRLGRPCYLFFLSVAVPSSLQVLSLSMGPLASFSFVSKYRTREYDLRAFKCSIEALTGCTAATAATAETQTKQTFEQSSVAQAAVQVLDDAWPTDLFIEHGLDFQNLPLFKLPQATGFGLHHNEPWRSGIQTCFVFDGLCDVEADWSRPHNQHAVIIAQLVLVERTRTEAVPQACGQHVARQSL